MDTPEASAGTTIYLGVNVDGGLFSIGDGHYTMGEGEVCGVAVEGAMNTLLTVEVIKGVFCEWPRLEDDDSIMVAGSYRPLEDAFRIAHTPARSAGSAPRPGCPLMDTYQLVTQASRSRIANVCDAELHDRRQGAEAIPAARHRLDGRRPTIACGRWAGPCWPPGKTRPRRRPADSPTRQPPEIDYTPGHKMTAAECDQ